MIRHAIALIAILAASSSAASAQQRMVSGVARLATAPEVVVVRPHTAPVRAALEADARLASEPVAGDFARSGFAQFMASPGGRVLRVVAGAAMIAGGLSMDSDGGTALAVVGAVPLSAGLFDVCWLSPIFGGPLKGKDIRAAK